MPSRVSTAISDFLDARRGYFAVGVGLAMLAAGGKIIKDVAAVPTALAAHDSASRAAGAGNRAQLDSLIREMHEANRLSREQICVMTHVSSDGKLACIGESP